MKEIFEQIDKWLQEAKDELSESVYAHEGGFHRGEVAAYTKVGVLLQQHHLTSHSSRAADKCLFWKSCREAKARCAKSCLRYRLSPA